MELKNKILQIYAKLKRVAKGLDQKEESNSEYPLLLTRSSLIVPIWKAQTKVSFLKRKFQRTK